MAKVYGSLVNRLEEGRTVKEIRPNMDLTMYYWSDRTCYYVTEVINQKNIKVKKYHVVASRDSKHPGGLGAQNWEYFKSINEQNAYLNKYSDDKEDLPTDFPEDKEEEWVFRYGKWKRKEVFTKDEYNNKYPNIIHKNNGAYTHLSEKDIEDLNNGKDIIRYYDLSGKISFDVRDYYYDWSF